MFAKKATAIAFALASIEAHAIPMLDFEGFQTGDQINECYNGGTSAFGKTCENLGISFRGGTIVNNEFGGQLRGGFQMTFDAGAIAGDRPYFHATMLATRWDIDGTHSWQLAADGRIVDAIWVAGTANPYCSSQAACDAKHMSYIDPNTLFGYEFNVFPEVNRLSMNTNWIDELWLDSPITRPPTRWANAPKAPINIADGGGATEVPEPAPLALMLTGLLWIGRSRLNLSGPPTGGGRYASNHGNACGDVSPCLPA